MDDAQLERQLRDLLEKEKIRELVKRYCHHQWDCDGAAMAALFTEDCEFSSSVSGVHLVGKPALKKFFGGVGYEASGRPIPYPYTHDHLIELDGDRATGICSLDLRFELNGEVKVHGGRYKDEYRKEGGEWKFRARRIKVVISGNLPQAPV